MSSVAPPEPPPQRPDDQSGEKYLTLMEHLQELRYRLMVSSIAVVIGLGVSSLFAKRLIAFLKDPAASQAKNFQLQFITPFENFMVYFRVSLLGGLVLAMPIIVYQVLRFVSPGLRASERRWMYGTVLGATGLFLIGVAFAYYVALPPALHFLLNFGNDYATPNIRIESYIDFVTRLLFWIGVAFETPLVIMYLARFGIVRSSQLWHWWRHAVVAAFVISAIVTPTWDPVTQTVVAGPIIVLYFLGMGLAVLVQPKRRADA